MTPQEIAEVRPRLLGFAAEMLGGLPRKDQRAAGELYVRGLLTDGQRKSMQPMAVRLGVEHQRLQQFITSSTWDYVAVRRNIARWFAAGQQVEALVVDDTGFPKDGTASPRMARQYSGTLGKTANCQVQPVAWRQGTKAAKGNPTAAMTSYFLAIRVRPANRDIPRADDGSLPDCWLLAEWPPKPMSPPITGCLTCPPIRRSTSWSGWPRSDGASSMTTANSSTASGWAASKAARSPAGTATSPSPPSPRPSAP